MRSLVALMLLGAPSFLHAGDALETSVSRALSHMEARDFAGACDILRPLTHQARVSADLWNLLGICESESGHKETARVAFENGVKLQPDSVGLLENLGFLEFRSGRFEDAKKHLGRAVSLGSAKPEVRFNLAVALIRTGDRKQGLEQIIGLETQLSSAQGYWTERGWAELPVDPTHAAESFYRALATRSDDVRALNGAAAAAEAQGENEKAISFLLRAKESAPDDVRTLMHFGSLCLRMDLTIDALGALERAHKFAPSDEHALFLDARAQIGVQQWQRSHHLFTEFDRARPHNAAALYALGWLEIKMNRPEQARQHLERSLAIQPNQADVRYELGQLALDEGLFPSAERELRIAIAEKPSHSKAHIALGDVLVKTERLAEARAQYEIAIQSDPKSGPAHYKLSTLLMRLHDTARAERERSLGATLNAEAEKAKKSVLVLAEPDGTLLSGDPETTLSN